MNKKDYLSEKQKNKETAKQEMVMIILFILIFLGIIFRFAIRPGTNEGFLSQMPSGDEAYDVAKDFIKPSITSDEAEFPINDFEYSKNSDSVYVIKSFFEKNDEGFNVKTNFTVTLKYNGGSKSNMSNWSLITLDKQ